MLSEKVSVLGKMGDGRPRKSARIIGVLEACFEALGQSRCLRDYGRYSQRGETALDEWYVAQKKPRIGDQTARERCKIWLGFVFVLGPNSGY